MTAGHAKKSEIKREVGGQKNEAQHVHIIEPIAQERVINGPEDKKALERLGGTFLFKTEERGNKSDECQNPKTAEVIRKDEEYGGQ